MMQVTSWWMMVVLVYWVSPSRALLLATPSPSNAISSAFTKQQTTRNNFPLAMISNRDSMRSSDVAMMQKSSISRDFARSSSRTKLQLASTSSSNISPKSSSSDENLPNYDFTNEDDVKQWLVGCKLYSLYKGFKMERAEVMIYLDHGKTEQDFITKFDGTITSYEDGLFRITRDDENTNRYEYKIEMIHVVRPDVCFYFDLDEKFIKWTGTLNMQTKTITNGIVTTNKKRFGIIPYVEELATFETIEIFDRLTEVPKHRRVYNIGHIPLEAPADFFDPSDMRKYPNIFHPEFVEWWEKVEDATARGEKPPPKPKEYFMPNPYATVEDPTGEINELKENELRAKEDELKGNKKKSKFSNKPKTGFQ